MRDKVCKICHNKFSPLNSCQKVCSMGCALEYSRNVREKHRKAQAKSARKIVKEAKDRLKSRNEWLKEAQSAFNAYIRARDYGKPCISCGRYHHGQMHAGHYRSTKAAPELRYSKLNCFLQCAPCNNHLSGNTVAYRKNLLKVIGQKNLDWIEGPHRPQRWTIEEVKEIKKHFKSEKRLLDESMVD